ncbi:MAG: HDOD domain-containing protein [Candidatus Krumholzibacteria bacterium]|nr:HDOD domain-containing protein [Candidatus Krumholzibacteria bacterium]
MLKGDLTKFSPGDLLSFLTHLNQEGVLTVSGEACNLTISFRQGLLVAAHSEQADAKVLSALVANGLITTVQYLDLDQARHQTGLPLHKIITDLGGVDLTAAGSVLQMGIQEVMFQLFTCNTGDFQFNEMTFDHPDDGIACDSTGLAMDAARQVDEYREFLRNVVSQDLVLHRTAAGAKVSDGAAPLEFVLQNGTGDKSLRQVVMDAPFTSFVMIKAVEEALQKRWLELKPGEVRAAEPAVQADGADTLFMSYKRSTLKVLQAQNSQEQISELIGYCRDHFDYFILFSLNGQQVVRSLRFQRDEDGRRVGTELPVPGCGLESDPTFRFVCESHTPFFGKASVLPLLKGLGEPDPSGDCAIIPLGGKGNSTYLLFVSAPDDLQIPGPLHYLEMISWQILTPRQEETAPASTVAAGDPMAPPGETSSAATMIAAVNELPPMPQVVTQVMDLLSDPDSQTSELIKILSLDPALVARLIRVSNSALYGRGEETTSLSQAVVRLGANTVRSLVMAASMKSLFPLTKANVGVWGQALWQHSIECGLAARRVAQIADYPDPEEAFVAGILHDVGKVVILLHKPDDYRAILKEQATAPGGSLGAERANLGFDHLEVGKLLVEKWQMPGNLQACVAHHHEPENAGENERLARIVALANHLSHAYGLQPDAALAAHAADFDQACAALNIPTDRAQALLAEIGSFFEHSGSLD